MRLQAALPKCERASEPDTLKQKRTSRRGGNIPKRAVLLIPEPEHEGEPPIYGVKPGYYDPKQMLQLIDEHKGDADAVQFIADMLETGDAENDGFAQMLRTNRHDPNALARIVEICKD
jgi:hypothetical protein